MIFRRKKSPVMNEGGKLLREVLVEQATLDLVHVQVDEIRVKGRRLTAWIILAL